MRSEALILDYSHYVEVVDEEECGSFGRRPMGIVAAADQLGAPANGAIRFFPGDLGSQIVEYSRERLDLFGSGDLYDKCQYCDTVLATAYESNRAFNAVFGRIVVRACPTCGWWESSDECQLEQRDDGWYRSRELRRRALLREFSVGGSEVPLEILREYVASHPTDLRFVSPRKLEDLVGKVFGEFMSCEAIHVGGPGDGGIDLILVAGDKSYVVQVKRRTSPTTAEAVSGIREFLGAMLLHGAIRGIFVSTAPRFSAMANAVAGEATRRRLIESIELVDAARLVDVCRLTARGVDPPWRKFAASPGDAPPSFDDDVYFAFPVGR